MTDSRRYEIQGKPLPSSGFGKTRGSQKLVVERIFYDVPVPQYATRQAAGIDLVSRINIVLFPGYWRLIPTGLKVQLPQNTEGQVRPRSGMANKRGLSVLNSPGTIDEDFRGELHVMAHNVNYWHNVRIDMWERIAQLVVVPVIRPQIVEGQVDETERAEGGFGSTGE